MRAHLYLSFLPVFIFWTCASPNTQKTSLPPLPPQVKESTPAPAATPTVEKSTPPVRPAPEVSFARDVLPILRKLAPDCHTAEDMAGNYALDSYEAVMAPGTDSVPNVVPGNPEKSLLYIYLQKGHPFGKKPDSAQLRIIRDWILQGAKNN
ncbi:hypothetical protein HPY86_03900 [candidate division WOR-3 bacterium]|nr:hypothetical protein [candidate division WOR-3 bacterium]